MTASTAVFVTHEAVHPTGGAGVVLHELLASPAYRRAFPRTLLIAPDIEPQGDGSYDVNRSAKRDLAMHGTVLYDGRAHRLPGFARSLATIERNHDVSLTYGTRPIEGTGESVEVLLIDVADVLRNYHVRADATHALVQSLREELGVDIALASGRPRSAAYRTWSFLCRRMFGYRLGAAPLVNVLYRGAIRHGLLAVPALDYDALAGVVLAPAAMDCLDVLCTEGALVVAQEHWSLPLAYAALLRRSRLYRTVFYSGEVRTARILVEYGDRAPRSASDARFYGRMTEALRAGRTMAEVFDVREWMSFQILRHGALCSRVGAVSATVADELRFLDRRFAERPIEVIPHGHRMIDVTAADASRARLSESLRRMVGRLPTYIFTHIARAQLCKAFLRDVAVCRHLVPRLRAIGATAVLLVITEWPREARPEVIARLADAAAALNTEQETLSVMIVNDPAWPAADGLSRDDLHRATDVTFSQSMYESFGIAQLEPLSAGAICVVSSVSGAAPMVRSTCAELGFAADGHPNIVYADYTGPSDRKQELLDAGGAPGIARAIFDRLPRDAAGRERLLRSGRALAERMQWPKILEEHLVPFLAGAS